MPSDGGPQFNNLFWKEVNALTGMKRKLSSAYHPHTDGQIERTNRTLEEMLRAYVQPDQNGMSTWRVQSLPLIIHGRSQ